LSSPKQYATGRPSNSTTAGLRSRFDDVERVLAKHPHQALAVDWADPRIMPEARYFSIPSTVVDGAARRKLALN
jgi:hypothetical protein